jgi:hypothetical protein
LSYIRNLYSFLHPSRLAVVGPQLDTRILAGGATGDPPTGGSLGAGY